MSTDSAIWDGESFRRTVAGEFMASRARGSAFKIVEFGAGAITVWKVDRDATGTPRVRSWPLPDVTRIGGDFFRRELEPLIGTTERVLVVFSSLGAEYRNPREVEALRLARPRVAEYQCPAPVEEQLRDIIRDLPLTQWYELVVLRQMPSGRIGLDSHPLFPPGAERGYAERVRIRCAPADGHGIVFAVVAREEDSDDVRPLLVQSAVIAPGAYEVTAELTRPGHVRFRGLPAELRPDPRPWQEIIDALPDEVTRRSPVHLICLLELTGTAEQVDRRIVRLEALMALAGTPDDSTRVSLVTYGPHGYDERQREEPARALAWAADPERALAVLRSLRGWQPPAEEYPRAAQLECALEEVASRLDARDGRPVLVAAGTRHPHPPRADLSTQILPCRRRVDWRRQLAAIIGSPGVRLAALVEPGTAGEAWERLGRDGAELAKLVDVHALARSLALTEEPQPVPFPLLA